MQVARGWKKKDVGDRKLSEQIAKMHVFTANAGERILSVTEMKQDANKPCATMLDEQWARMEKSKKEAKNEVEGARYEDTKLGRRRVLFYAGKQFGLYGKEKGRPKSSTATLLTCDENTLIVVAHASKTAVKPSETRKLLWELTATLGPKTK